MYLCTHFVKVTFFAMILYKIPITQAILIFRIFRQENRWKFDISAETIKIFLIVLTKY